MAKSPTGAHRGRLVDERHLDRVGPDDAGVDEVVGARSGDGVEPGDQVGDRRVVVVLDLDEADDIGVEFDDRGDDLVPLAVAARRRCRRRGSRGADRAAIAASCRSTSSRSW